MENLTKNITWTNVPGTQAQIKGYVNNYAKDFNVYVGNLVINGTNVSFTTYAKFSYEQLVNKLVAEKYTIQDELAIQRKHQKGVNNAEFEEYDTYVEQCKLQAKAFIEERNEALGV